MASVIISSEQQLKLLVWCCFTGEPQPVRRSNPCLLYQKFETGKKVMPSHHLEAEIRQSSHLGEVRSIMWYTRQKEILWKRGFSQLTWSWVHWLSSLSTVHLNSWNLTLKWDVTTAESSRQASTEMRCTSNLGPSGTPTLAQICTLEHSQAVLGKTCHLSL